MINFELFKQFLDDHDNPSLIFKAWSGGVDPVIYATFCHFCYDSKKDTIPDYYRGIRVYKIKGIFIGAGTKLCQEHQ